MIEGVRWVGDRAFLVEFSALEDVMAFAARVRADPVGQVDLVAAARTVLVTFTTSRWARRAVDAVHGIDLSAVPVGERRAVDVDVVYDGDDLAEVADFTGLSTDAVVAAHTASEWIAAFGGFAPGFAYLVGGDPRLRVPRRDAPRAAVPSGSVALAGEFSAVYPRRSPGGWRLIGRTEAELWDLDRDPPALVRPGDLVRFRAVRAFASGRDASARADDAHSVDGSGRVRGSGIRPPAACCEEGVVVVAPGPLSLIEDLGRPGLVDIGVSPSGAADTRSARQANRLVGNARDAAVVECVLGGLAVRAVGSQVMALTGADSRARILRFGDVGDPVDHASPFLLRDGETLTLGTPQSGLRTYLAMRGGVDVPTVLGSRSADRLGAIGPPPLRAGDPLPVGSLVASAVGAQGTGDGGVTFDPPGPGGDPAAATNGDAGTATIRIRLGPRDDWFATDERRHLVETVWVVEAQSDRVGIRLAPESGARALRPRDADLPSEGLVAGAIQVPPSGEPVIFGPDHPVTGGYPVIAVVVDDDLPDVAQLRPGSLVRFRTLS